MHRSFLLLSAALAAVSIPSHAQTAEPPPIRSLELSAGAQHLTNGFGPARELTLQGRYGAGRHLLALELSAQRRFGASGTYLGVGDTYTFDEDWFGSLSAGAGDGAFFLPRLRVDASVSRKLLADRRLVATLGAGYYDAPDGHTDRSVSLGGAYYFEAPWIVEGGVRFNRSNPGGVATRQQFAAVTWGRAGRDLVTARAGWGAEGYQSIGPATQLVNFDSREASVAWRHWLRPETGIVLGANHYTNPLYRRSGITVGLFHQF